MISSRIVTVTAFVFAAGLGNAAAQTNNPPSRPDRPAVANRQRPSDFQAGGDTWSQALEQWRRERAQVQRELERRRAQTPEAQHRKFDDSVGDYFQSVPRTGRNAVGSDAAKVRAGRSILDRGGRMLDNYGGLAGAIADSRENDRAIAELERQLRELDYNIEFAERTIDSINTEWQRANEWEWPVWMREYAQQAIEMQNVPIGGELGERGVRRPGIRPNVPRTSRSGSAEATPVPQRHGGGSRSGAPSSSSAERTCEEGNAARCSSRPPCPAGSVCGVN